MNKYKIILTLGLFLSLILLGIGANENIHANQKSVTVALDFGSHRPYQTETIKWYQGMTALVALKQVSSVQTKKYHNWILVNSINGIKSERAKFAWFFDLNGLHQDKMPGKVEMKPGDFLRWIYMYDFASHWLDHKIWPDRKHITIAVDYGMTHPYLFTAIEWQNGITTLDAIQRVTEVKTSQFQNHPMVDSINGIKGKPGSMVWYFDVNDEPAVKMADQIRLKPGDVVRWVYIKDFSK